jgi:hypothetical protein
MAGILKTSRFFVYADRDSSGYITEVMKNTAAVLLGMLLTASFVSGEPVIPMPGFESPQYSHEAAAPLVLSVKEEGWTPDGRIYSREMFFDDRGNLREERYTNGDDSPGSWIEYGYDPEGRLTEKIFHHPDAAVPDTEIYTWEGNRLLSVARLFTTGRYGWRYEYSYDEQGRLALATKIDRYWKDVVVWRKTYVYDDLGRLIKSTGGGLDENIQWTEEYSYDAEDPYPTEKRRWDARGELNSLTRFEFDAGGNLLAEKEYTKDGGKWSEILFRYRFDDRENWTEKILGTPEGWDRSHFAPTSWYTRKINYRD